MSKIRILHVAQAAGGVDRYIRMLLKYLDKDEFENILVCSQDFHEEDYEGLIDSFEQIEMTRAICKNDLKAIKEVRKLIKKYIPDIVYAHSSKAGAIARMADIGLKNYCIYNPHGWAFNMRCSKKKKMMYIVIEKIAAFFCDKIICISDAEKESALKKKICKEEKLQVIFNGIDIDAYERRVHAKLLRYPIRALSAIIKVMGPSYSEGSWYGNNTISRTILDVNRVVLYANKEGIICDEPQRNIIILADMIVSGEGEGPLLPSPKDVGMILAGTNPVCFDEVVSTLMGFDYKKIPSIILAQNAKDRLALINDETAIISSNSSQYDKKTIDMLSKSDLLYFTPSEGWKGHIEKI